MYSASTVDQIPKQMASGLMFGTGTRAGARHRPHRPPADAGRQPAGLQRQPDDRARHARPAARDPRPRRQDRRHRPAAHPHRRGGRRAPLHPPRHRRPAAVRAGAGAVRRGPGRPAASVGRRICTGLDEVRDARRTVHPRGGRRDLRHRGRTRSAASPASWPPRRRAAVYGRIGTCTQEFGTLASWLVDVLNVLTGNLDRAGGAMFPRPPPGAANAAGTPGRGRGARFGRCAAACAGSASVRRAAGGLPGRGDRDARRGPGPRADHVSRQPGALDAQQRPARRALPSSTSWSASTSTSTRRPATPT